MALHEPPRALEDDERRMPFVQVRNAWLEPQRLQCTPAANSEDHLLKEPGLHPLAVQLGRDPPIDGTVERLVSVEEVQVDPSYVRAPDTEPERSPPQLDGNAKRPAGLRSDLLDRETRRIVVWIRLALVAPCVDGLTEVPLLEEYADSDERKSARNARSSASSSSRR